MSHVDIVNIKCILTKAKKPEQNQHALKNERESILFQTKKVAATVNVIIREKDNLRKRKGYMEQS